VATKIELMSNYYVSFICKDSMDNLESKRHLQERQISSIIFSYFIGTS